MKHMSILFILGWALLLVFAFEAQAEDSERECGGFWWKCGSGKPACCPKYVCSPKWGLCNFPMP
uniref:Kappa-Theraphotoxin-Ct1a_1 n=1 Tax=Coremiocnemis tropix TaxID=1904443 RepID=A0A482Z9G0_CORTR